MQSRQFAVVAAFVFAMVAVMQFVRAVSGWSVVVDSHEIPLAASWVAGAVAGLLAITGFMTARR